MNRLIFLRKQTSSRQLLSSLVLNPSPTKTFHLALRGSRGTNIWQWGSSDNNSYRSAAKFPDPESPLVEYHAMSMWIRGLGVDLGTQGLARSGVRPGPTHGAEQRQCWARIWQQRAPGRREKTKEASRSHREVICATQSCREVVQSWERWYRQYYP